MTSSVPLLFSVCSFTLSALYPTSEMFTLLEYSLGSGLALTSLDPIGEVLIEVDLHCVPVTS